MITTNLCQFLGQNLMFIMSISFAKPPGSVDFIEWVVKTAHIKNNSYMWTVAKISQYENKIATCPITLIIGKISIDSLELSLVIISGYLVLGF